MDTLSAVRDEVYEHLYQTNAIPDLEKYMSKGFSDKSGNSNSDAALSLEKTNSNNAYKDQLRTIEIQARQQLNAGKKSIFGSIYEMFCYQMQTWRETAKRYEDIIAPKSLTQRVGIRTGKILLPI